MYALLAIGDLVELTREDTPPRRLLEHKPLAYTELLAKVGHHPITHGRKILQTCEPRLALLAPDAANTERET